MNTSETVADWLNGLERTSAIPAEVTIGRTTYHGAYYSQSRDVHEGTRAYAEGERRYLLTAFYLLGTLPASYVRTTNIAYVFDGAARRWFIGGYYPQQPQDLHASNDWHPFGPMFQLMPDTTDVTVLWTDSGEPYPVMRMRLERFGARELVAA